MHARLAALHLGCQQCERLNVAARAQGQEGDMRCHDPLAGVVPHSSTDYLKEGLVRECCAGCVGGRVVFRYGWWDVSEGAGGSGFFTTFCHIVSSMIPLQHIHARGSLSARHAIAIWLTAVAILEETCGVWRV